MASSAWSTLFRLPNSAHRFVNALRQKYGRDLPKFYASVVSAELAMGWYGPDLEALDIQRGGKVSDVYQPICEEVAKIIGIAVPIWPSRLRDFETIKTWKPGAAPAIVRAFDSDVPTEPFTTLAAEEPDDSPVALVCRWLAETIRERATERHSASPAQDMSIACIGVRIGTPHMKHVGPAQASETVGGSSRSSQLSPGGGSTEMISDGCPDPNRKVPVQGVSENLLPTAQSWRLCRPGFPVAAPCTRASHTYLFCDVGPAQVLVTKLQDLLCGGRMGRRAATTHGDPGAT